MTHAPQIKIPATYMRGGTSKGVFFSLQDLPEVAQVPGAARDALLLRVIGSPDPYGKQTDGMGGATSSTSKTVILSKSTFKITILRPRNLIPSTPERTYKEKGWVNMKDWIGKCGWDQLLQYLIEAFLIGIGDGYWIIQEDNLQTGPVIISTLHIGGWATTKQDLFL